jgi:predicted phosphodiesterase
MRGGNSVKKIDLGVLSGDILVFGGVYSNLHALEALIARAVDMGIAPSNMICTGDVVAYCAYAEDSVQRIRDLGCVVLSGNCEQQLAVNADDCGCGFEKGSTCSLLSRAWFAHANSQISDGSREWMGELPDRITFTHNGLRYGVVHGGASDVSRFIWPVTTDDEIAAEIALLESQVGVVDRVLAGHSGIVMTRELDNKMWINAGAIGMPAHDGDIDTRFTIISENSIDNKVLEYNIEAAFQAMQANALTQGYHATLKTGYWPSEEILPVEMRL